MNIHWIAEHFQTIQLLLLGSLMFITIRALNARDKKSQFKVREADRKSNGDLPNKKTDAKTAPPLSLPGIRLQGAPHDVLGIPPHANQEEIMKAFKELMKRFHPDRVHGIPPEQMNFYQDAAAKINHAKEAMLDALKK